MTRPLAIQLLCVCLLLLSADLVRGAEPAPSAITPQQIEADWFVQEHVRKPGISPGHDVGRPRGVPVTTGQDAAGGCDGRKDGTYGFHTNQDASPWWQVDLGEPLPLARAVIYNRCDGNVEDRAGRLTVLLSTDGKTWTEVYRHDGTKFFGYTDGRPLTIALKSNKARFVRVQLPERQYLHLDEVEVYPDGTSENAALKKPADQSSTSQWSQAVANATESLASAVPEGGYPTDVVVKRGLDLAENLRRLGANVDQHVKTLERVSNQWRELSSDAEPDSRRRLYLEARWAVRHLALANPLLDFDDLLFVKRVPGSFTHMCDQYYGWFSRPGGGLYILQGFKTDAPKLRCLTTQLPRGSVLRPDVSYDGKRVLFAHCKYYPGVAGEKNKLDKDNVPEDAFYHLYEMNLDGTGLRRLTRGKYDDFDGRYLPDGRIVFLSTRRGQFIQCGKQSATQCIDGAGPDSYVRCGGGPERPVAVYTLHVMDADGGNPIQISPFEMFEWTPSIDHEGRILYARWDYVDRHNMPFMSLWSTMPDGTDAQAVFGNYTRNPHCIFEARAIPNSHKLVFTASAHHGLTAGGLVLLDPRKGSDGEVPMTRLTPGVCFPESEGWPKTYFANPYPLAEEHYLVAWSAQPVPPGVPPPAWGSPGPPNDLGLYLFDSLGNLNLIYRDPDISSMTPLPIRPRRRPPQVASQVRWDGPQEGRMLLVNVYQGLESVPRGRVRRLRLVGVPAKTHPTMNKPNMGLTRDDPGKFVMGTVPVEEDGSAYFRVPAGVTFFLQALDDHEVAVQTMRSGVYVQPGQTYACVGCHEKRHTAPPRTLPSALTREPSPITPGPDGSWPLDFQSLVQPVMQQHCVSCHRPKGKAPKWDLTASRSYETLVSYGRPSLRDHVQSRYNEGRSIAGAGAAQTNPLLPLLKKDHHKVRLTPDDLARLTTWMDTYGQRLGSFDKQQEQRLVDLRRTMAPMLAE